MEQPTLVTSPSGRQTRIIYDKRWRKQAEITGFGTSEAAATLYTWDGTLLASVTDPLLRQTTHVYDPRGRRILTVNPLGGGDGTWQFTYDANGNQLKTIRPTGFGYSENAYDERNRLVQTWDPKRQTVRYAYDGGGRRKLLRDPRGYDYTFQYNGRNKMTKFIYPGGGSDYEEWTYDDAGNKLTYRTRGAVVATYVHDNRNRMTSETWNDGITLGVTYDYDAANRVILVQNANSTVTSTYHPGGELWTETQNIAGSSGARTLTYAYDLDGRRSKLTYPSGTVLDYTYTNRGQLKDISADGPPPMVTYSYDLAGNRLTRTLENSTGADYAYDDLNRVIMINHYSNSSDVALGDSAGFAMMEYGYDAVHRRSWVKRSGIPGGKSANPRGDVFAYDAADQLIGVKFDALDPDTAPSAWTSQEGFGYDAAGNRQADGYSVNGTQVESRYYNGINPLNQYYLINGVTNPPFASYNAGGSLSYDPLTGLSLTYDAQEKPLTISKAGLSISEKRDGRQRVVSRTTNGVTTFFIWDDWSLVEEITGTTLARQINGAAIDETIARLAGTTTIFFAQDALQSTVALTDGSGSVVERYRYRSFGNTTITDDSGTARIASAYANRIGFTGREAIGDTGLLDYRNRIGNVAQGRWMQSDPIRFDAKDSNLYRYVFNSPATNGDPLGLILTCNQETGVVEGEPDDPFPFSNGPTNSAYVRCMIDPRADFKDKVRENHECVCQKGVDGLVLRSKDPNERQLLYDAYYRAHDNCLKGRR